MEYKQRQKYMFDQFITYILLIKIQIKIINKMLSPQPPTLKYHKRRLVYIIILSTIGLVLGLILIMIALQRIFFGSWHNNIIFNSSCPKSQSINFLNKINILQIIFIVMLSISTGLFVILLCISLYNILNIQKWYKYWNKLHIFYSVCLSIGLLTALVVLLYVLKLFINCNAVKNSYQQGKINSKCFSQSSFAFLQDKMSTLIILLVLAGIMLLLYIFNVALLPSRFMIGQNPKFIKKHLQLNEKVGVSIPNAQVSRDQILFNNKIRGGQQNLIPITSTERRINSNEIGINTEGDIYLVKTYRNQQAQITQLQQDGTKVLNKNKIQTEQIGIETVNPKMRNMKVQVNLQIPIIEKLGDVKKDDVGVEIGVWTGDGLYKVKSSGVQAVNQTLYRSFGIGQNQVDASETQYQSCGVGDDDIWNPQYYNQNTQPISQNNKNLKIYKTRSQTQQAPRQLYQQSETTRQNNRVPALKSFKPETPVSQNSTFRPMSSTTQGYYYMEKQIIEPELNAIAVSVPQKKPEQSIFKKNKINRSKIDERSQEYQDATINFVNDSKSNLNREKPYQNYVDDQTPSRRTARLEKMNKLRQRFNHRIIARSQSEEQKSPSYQNEKNPISSKMGKNLKIDTTFLQKQKQKIQAEDNLTYKKQLMGEYMQKSSHTPQRNKLQDKGTIPEFLKMQLLKPDGNKGGNCHFFEPGTWCSGAWCG